MMKSKLLNSLILAALAAPGVAMADAAPAPAPAVVANVGWVSNYVFRGITQTIGKPAVQGGFDYSHASGFYAGVWGSNVSWITGSYATGDASLETDTYLGMRNSFATDFSYDVGFIRYNYFGTYTPPAGYAKADTNEAYGSVGYKWISAKLSYATGGAFLTMPGAAGTTYLEVNASIPVGDSGVTVGAHYGKQKYKGAPADAQVLAGFDPSYSDYKLSASKDFGGYVVGLAYSNTNAKSGGYYTFQSNGVNRDWGKSAVALSVIHSF